LAEYASSHTLDELLQATLDEAEALTGSAIGFYHFVEADQRTLCLQAWSTRTLGGMCNAEGKGLHYDLDKAGVWVDCVHEQKPVIHNDYSALPHRRGMPAGHAEVVRELVVPVFRGDRLVAILGVGNKPVDYATSDIETVSLLADLAWDISERKRAETALQAASAYNRSLIEASLDPLVTISAEGKITDVNTATERVTGYSREELIGTDFADYFTDPEKARSGYEQVFRDGLVKDYELTIRHRDGWLTPVMYNASLYRDDSGKAVGIFAAARDISERKRAEEALIRSNEDLQQFAYVASHDLQEPLRNVANCLQMLEQDYKDKLDAGADQYIRYAVESSVRMKDLILGLLD
jgi:PAS domain S-box-containing protein